MKRAEQLEVRPITLEDENFIQDIKVEKFIIVGNEEGAPGDWDDMLTPSIA